MAVTRTIFAVDGSVHVHAPFEPVAPDGDTERVNSKTSLVDA